MSTVNEPEEVRLKQTDDPKELKSLSSHNQPGFNEGMASASGTRTRIPTIASAKARYEIAMDNLKEKLNHLEDPARRNMTGNMIRAEYNDIKQAEIEGELAANDLKRAFDKNGSTAESDEVDNQLVAFQTRIDAFKQGCRIDLRPTAGSVAFSQKTMSQTSRVSKTSSRAKLARAELKKRSAQEQFLKKADELEMQKRQTTDELEMQKQQMEMQKRQVADELEMQKRQVKRKGDELEMQKRQVEREGELAGLNAEIQALEEDSADEETQQQINRHERSLIHLTVDQMANLGTTETDAWVLTKPICPPTRQPHEIQSGQPPDQLKGSGNQLLVQADVHGTPIPRMGSYGDELTINRNPGGLRQRHAAHQGAKSVAFAQPQVGGRCLRDTDSLQRIPALGQSNPTSDTGTPDPFLGSREHSGTPLGDQSQQHPGTSIVASATSQLAGTIVTHDRGRSESVGTLQGEYHMWAANRQLALAGIKGNFKALKFDGKVATSYLRWKNALKLEVAGLDLSPREWLEMLALRTSHTALDIVTRANEMGIADPGIALEFIWEEFEGRYKGQPLTANKVLLELQNFRQIKRKDTKALFEFALVCRQATKLATTKEEMALAVLDFANIQKSVTTHLDEGLRRRWKVKYGKIVDEDPESNVPFSRFTEWIGKVAKEASHAGVQFETDQTDRIKDHNADRKRGTTNCRGSPI